MKTYTITAPTRVALLDLLAAAQAGKERPFVITSFEGRMCDPSRIIGPEAVMVDDGEPYALLDAEELPVLEPETGEPVMIQQQVVDHWTCAVFINGTDEELAAIAVEV